MNLVQLGEYEDMYLACSRLDDARLLNMHIDTEQKPFSLELTFNISTNPSNPYKRFFINCLDLEEFTFSGIDFNQFMMMSGYPDSLFVRAENGMHALYFLPNNRYPSSAEKIDIFEIRVVCRRLYWRAD